MDKTEPTITAEKLEKLAIFDKTPARFAALLLLDAEMDAPTRTLLVCSVLAIDKNGLLRCAEVLERHGMGRVAWMN